MGIVVVFIITLILVRFHLTQIPTTRERLRPADVPLSPISTPKWRYIADHSVAVVEADTTNIQRPGGQGIRRAAVFGNGFVVWLEHEGEPPAARLYQGWLSGDQMQDLFDYIAHQGFWEMETRHTQEISCDEKIDRRGNIPFHFIQVRLNGKERRVEEHAPYSCAIDWDELGGAQPGFAALFDHLVHGAGVGHKEDYYPTLGCLSVNPMDASYAKSSNYDPYEYPEWPFAYQASLGYVPIGAGEQASISGSGLFLVRVSGDVLDFAWRNVFDIDSNSEKIYREGERAYKVRLEVPEIMPHEAATCPGRAQEPSSHPPFPTALPPATLTPIPTATPIPGGQWTLYDPLGDSGWTSLYPPNLSELHAIAFADSEHAMAAGSDIMRYYPDRTPAWWRLVRPKGQIGSWFPSSIWVIAPTGPDSGWLAGTDWPDKGWLVRYEGDSWQRVLGPTTERLWDIHMLTPHEGWAVGENGTIWRYAGHEWEAARAPTTHTLYSLSMVTPDLGWAVGRDGTILRYDGSRWSQDLSPTREHLRGVSMMRALDGTVEGWAVGAQGVLVHYRSGHSPEWELVSGPVEDNLHAVAVQAPDNVWAVGENGALLYYDGATWKTDPAFFDGPEYVPADTLWDVVMLSRDEGWAVGGGTILHYHDGVWELVSEPYPRAWRLDFVDFVSPDDGWIMRYDGGFLHYDGARWRIASSIPQYTRCCLEMVSHNQGWAASDYLYQFDGHEWSRVFLPEDTRILDLQMLELDRTEGWAVGEKGRILHYADGQWTLFESPTIANLYHLSMLSPDEGWAAGRLPGRDRYPPVLLRYTSGSWEVGPTWPISRSYVIDFEMVSPDEGWFIYGIENDTTSSYILHYRDGRWQEIDLPAIESPRYDTMSGYKLEAIDMTSPDEGWIVGEAILYYHDGRWEAVTPYLGVWGLQDVVMLSPQEGWAVGGSGTIMRFSASP